MKCKTSKSKIPLFFAPWFKILRHLSRNSFSLKYLLSHNLHRSNYALLFIAIDVFPPHSSERVVLHACASRLREFITHRPIGFSINNGKCSHSAKSEPRHLAYGPAIDLLQIFESGSRSGEIKISV